MTFEEYLAGKKIDSEAFRLAEPERWQEWSQLFAAMSPASFTAQKLYLINPVRRKYVLKKEETQTKEATPQPRPVMKPKPKID